MRQTVAGAGAVGLGLGEIYAVAASAVDEGDTEGRGVLAVGGERLVGGEYKGVTKIYDTSDGAVLAEWHREKRVYALAVTRDGVQVAVGADDYQVFVHELRSGGGGTVQTILTFQPKGPASSGQSRSADCSRLAVGCWNCCAFVYENAPEDADVMPFIAVVLITLIGFAMGLALLLYGNGRDFGDPASAFASAFNYGLYSEFNDWFAVFSVEAGDAACLSDGGGGEIVEGRCEKLNAPAAVLFQIMMLMVQVLMCNMLIAIMTDSYDKVRENAGLESAYEQGKLLLEIEAVAPAFPSAAPPRRARRRRDCGRSGCMCSGLPTTTTAAATASILKRRSGAVASTQCARSCVPLWPTRWRCAAPRPPPWFSCRPSRA